MGLSGCAVHPKVTIPEAFLEPCKSEPVETVKSVNDLAFFSVRQEAEIQSCEAKRQGLVNIVKGKK